MNEERINVEHHRRSIRLQGYDYSSPGMYFITVCTEGKVCSFGEIRGGEMKLNDAGNAVVQAWMAIPERFPSVQLDSFVVMPNHIHGIIFILGKDGPRGKGAASSARTAILANARPTLGKIMRAFKSVSAIKINEIVGRIGRPVWHRNYYEHIVRRGKDLDEIRNYIAENPRQWASDAENPGKTE
jgi:putative transposase